MSEFAQVTKDGNWCYVDQLDGRHFEKGERVEVRWPDGSVSEHDVCLDTHIGTVSDMGRPCAHETTAAYVEVAYRDLVARVPLYQKEFSLEVRRIS